jgi:hypothetical protein
LSRACISFLAFGLRNDALVDELLDQLLQVADLVAQAFGGVGSLAGIVVVLVGIGDGLVGIALAVARLFGPLLALAEHFLQQGNQSVDLRGEGIVSAAAFTQGVADPAQAVRPETGRSRLGAVRASDPAAAAAAAAKDVCVGLVIVGKHPFKGLADPIVLGFGRADAVAVCPAIQAIATTDLVLVAMERGFARPAPTAVIILHLGRLAHHGGKHFVRVLLGFAHHAEQILVALRKHRVLGIQLLHEHAVLFHFVRALLFLFARVVFLVHRLVDRSHDHGRPPFVRVLRDIDSLVRN